MDDLYQLLDIADLLIDSYERCFEDIDDADGFERALSAYERLVAVVNDAVVVVNAYCDKFELDDEVSRSFFDECESDIDSAEDEKVEPQVELEGSDEVETDLTFVPFVVGEVVEPDERSFE